jgi:hypothetical protein
MRKLLDKLQGAERERMEREKSAEEVALARAGEERRGLDLARERQAAEVELRRLAHAQEALTRKALDSAAAEAAATQAAQERAEREHEMQLALAARAEAAAAKAASARVRADAKALAVLQKRLAAAQKSEAQANRRAEAESAAADVVRAGIAMEEVLDKLPAHARARPARRWPWIAAGAALIGLTVAYGFLPVPTLDSAPGEPLKLKLEFAFPAARR